MNHCLPTKCRAMVALLAVLLLPTEFSVAQVPGYGTQGRGTQGYQAPNFSGMARQAGGDAQMPTFPAALLAGGPAAAQGGEFMDVQGRQIQLTNYCPDGGCSGGYGGAPCGGPGCGDPMGGGVDFGGYGQDQCGPHYFDIQAGVVFLQVDSAFGDSQAFTSVGVAGPDRRLNGDAADYEAGWEIAARYDVGALAVLEATYMGVYDLGFSESVNSVDVAPGGVDFQLFSIFSNFGVGTLVPGIDDGRSHSLDYQADLQSTEISLRRYWVGNNPRVSGTFLLGARYLRYTDEVTFNSQGLVIPLVETASLRWAGENDLVGAQAGGDAWLCLRQGLRIGVEGTAGIYNNRFKFANSGTFSATTAPADFVSETEGNHVAFATEAEVSMVADILPSWSLRGGYRVLYMDRLATGAGSINQANVAAVVGSPDGDLLIHGFHGGLEYVW